MALPAHAFDWEGVFEGTIGKSKVIVELNAGADASAYKGGYSEGSRYSYLGKSYDLNLIARDEDTQMVFSEALDRAGLMTDAPSDDSRFTGTWSLDVTAAGASGTWKPMKGKKVLPITLKRVALVDQAEVPSDSNQLSATYNALWLKTVTFADAGKSV